MLWIFWDSLLLDLLGLWELFHILSLDLHGLKNLLQHGRQQLETRPCCLEGLSDPCCVKVWQKENSRGRNRINPTVGLVGGIFTWNRDNQHIDWLDHKLRNAF